MPSAAALRLQIEQGLEARFPSALTPAPRTIREVASTGIDAADELLEGGLPVGAITELIGPASSGRTTFALSFLAQRTAEARICAWVDAQDALDPESAAANGVHLKQLLWVRCRDTGTANPSRDRLQGRPWTRLDQALRATDLLLQAGGFAAIVLDLADTAPEHANRIPLATWFRFRQAADRTRCSLLVLGQAAYAQSSAALAIECAPLAAEAAAGKVLRGFTYQLQRGRQRFHPGVQGIRSGMRKPPASTWSAGTAWDAEERA
ncbi:DNA recombination/repair protein RecA [Acidobacteria bacterium AB60]|nr:DNA recombination/repair protein RecA [Acidobacteria bacterium AB60]